MSEVIIKEIGENVIWLKEINAYEFRIYPAIIGTSVIIIITLFLYIISPLNTAINVCIPVIGLLFSMVVILVGMYDKIIPSYEVSCGFYIGGEIIHKTNPEDDQIAICKAANRLEQKILDNIQKDNKLEIIASKCR